MVYLELELVGEVCVCGVVGEIGIIQVT